MKKIKVLLQVTLVMLLALSCTKNEEEKINLNETNNFSYYVDQSKKAKKISDEAIIEIKKLSSKGIELSDDQVTTMLFEYIEKNNNEDIYELTSEDYNQITSISQENISLNETGLSIKALKYFNQLEELNSNQNFEGMVELLNQYKLEYNSDPHLESLAGVFSVIELYKDDLLFSQYHGKGCISGDALAGAAISGAISGAVWGFKLGSWLGPAGTALGTLGGAIAGATISTIISIGVQGVRC